MEVGGAPEYFWSFIEGVEFRGWQALAAICLAEWGAVCYELFGTFSYRRARLYVYALKERA